MEAKLWFTLKKPTFSATHQTCQPDDFDLCQSAARDSRSPVPVSVWWWGKPQSSLMWLSAPQPSLSVLKPTRHKMERCTRDAQCSLPRKPRARHRHPIKALGTPRCELSQLGFVWAQIFEHCSTARVPLAEHHRIPRPKQKFGGRVEGWRCGWRGCVNVGNVHNACLYTSLFSLPPHYSNQADFIKLNVEENTLYTHSTEVIS